MKSVSRSIALLGALTVVALAVPAGAFQDCPTGVTCTQYTGAGKNSSYFRINVPENWDGDVVVYNHGFDLNRKHIRNHETCENNSLVHCEADADCGSGNACNEISYSGLDALVLPMGKAIAASTYSNTGWAPFDSAKDIKEILKFMKKEPTIGKPTRVIITGHSGGGAVTADATLKMKIDGAVPMCGAVAGGLPTWDTAVDVRLVYDFLCDEVVGARFTSQPDIGEKTTADSGADEIAMALKVNTCFGVLFPSSDPGEAAAQADRLSDFIALTEFTGTGMEALSAMGFATLGLGDFVRDEDRLNGKHMGFNATPDLDYSTMGTDPVLAGEFDTGVKRLTQGSGRKKLTKASYPDFTKGKGKKVAYPILSMAGAADWLVIPPFQSVYDRAAQLGGKLLTQTWISTYGHCTFSAQETQALFDEYFAWLDSADLVANQPTADDLKAACLALPGGIDGDTCNFDTAFVNTNLDDRIPARSDWPPAAINP
ncbi:MAG: hypothetical protein HY899_11995 [Deltaproteobacteria bacterium]|nr:hypothetical protein [Deltaproteobacteria bacterium]